MLGMYTNILQTSLSPISSFSSIYAQQSFGVSMRCRWCSTHTHTHTHTLKCWTCIRFSIELNSDRSSWSNTCQPHGVSVHSFRTMTRFYFSLSPAKKKKYIYMCTRNVCVDYILLSIDIYIHIENSSAVIALCIALVKY